MQLIEPYFLLGERIDNHQTSQDYAGSLVNRLTNDTHYMPVTE
jgi:hypothetical protein